MDSITRYVEVVLSQTDPTYLPIVILPLGVVTSWGVSKGCRFLWAHGCGLLRKALRYLSWYGSIGMMAFALIQLVRETLGRYLQEWAVTKQTQYMELKDYVQQGWSWVQGNQYATLIIIAALSLTYSYPLSQSKVVDDLGNSNSNNNHDSDMCRRNRTSDNPNAYSKSVNVNLHPSRTHRALVKSMELPTISVGPGCSSTISKALTVSNSRCAKENGPDEFLSLAKSLQVDIQQLKEVVVALSLRIREVEVCKTKQNESDKEEQEIADIFEVIAQESKKRSRKAQKEEPEDGLTENELCKLIGKTKKEIIQEFREQMMKEAAKKREPDSLTEAEANLAMKSLSELDIEWRKKKDLPVKEFHHRGIGVLTKEQTQLRRREIVEIIRARRSDDYVMRMKEMGRAVMRCPDCNQQFLVERGHRCYTAQWKVQAPKGPLPVERKIIVSQTGGGAVQVKPVTRVNINKLDDKLKKLNNYKLIHQKVEEEMVNQQGDTKEEPQRRVRKESDDIELCESAEDDRMDDVCVNQVEIQFQALMDKARTEKKLGHVIPFREGVRPHESPTRC